MITLHGAGQRGDDNAGQLLVNFNSMWSDSATTPISNSMTTVMEILDSLSKEFSLDSNRYYVSGISMGGFGTWYLMMKYPHKFAAGIPVCGGADPKMASTIKHIPVWTFHSIDDIIVPVQGTQEMVAALLTAGGKPKFDEFPASLHFGHNAWDSAAATKGLAAWLFSHTKNGMVVSF